MNAPVSIRAAVECVGRGVCGKSALYRLFSPGRTGRDSWRSVPVYRLIFVQQCLSGTRARIPDLASGGRVDSGRGFSALRIRPALPSGY